MFYCPYSDYCSSHYREQQGSSYVRVLHASPNAPAVDVYVNDKLAVRNISFKGFSPYLRLAPGRYNVKIYPAGKKDTPVLNTSVDIPARTILTAAAIGLLPEISLLPVVEPVFNRRPGRAYVRFVHLSPNAPNVDVVTRGRKVFTNVAYKQITDYIQVLPGVYTFDINAAGTDTRALHVPNVRLLPNRIYTIYAVGLVGKTPPLQALIPLDGNTYLKV